MAPQIDVGKLVGAASAPVALIIAASILLGNLGGKYSALTVTFRQVASDFRSTENRNSIRCRSLERQLTHYSTRLRHLIRATFYLTLAVYLFILTVAFTGLSVMFPNHPSLAWITAACSFGGLLTLGVAVTLEMIENHRGLEDLVLETAEFDGVLGTAGEKDEKNALDPSRDGDS